MASLDAREVPVMLLLEVLGAYFPDYLCSPCLAVLIEEPEAEVRAALIPTTGLEFATAVCLKCNVSKGAVRFQRRWTLAPG